MWQGFKSVRNMDGGYIAWMEKRFPAKVELKYDELWFISANQRWHVKLNFQTLDVISLVLLLQVN